MKDGKEIDITDLLKKRDEKKYKKKEEPEDFTGVLLVEFDKHSCSFKLLFENKDNESLDLDEKKVLHTIYRLFEIVEVLAEEFHIDL